MKTTTAMSARSLQYYVIGNRWASDLEFFKTETSFFYHLLDEYFARLHEPSHLQKYKQVIAGLNKLETDKAYTGRLLDSQLRQVELMAEDIIPEDMDSLADKQIGVEYLVTALFKEYRAVKSELFALIAALKKNKGTENIDR